MPEKSSPPNFDFYADRPDQRISDDENDFRQAEPLDLEYTVPGLPALVYPQQPERFTRAGDFETREIERLRAENEKLQAENDILSSRDFEEFYKAAYWELGAADCENRIKNLTAQLEAARAEFLVVYDAARSYAQERLEKLGDILGV